MASDETLGEILGHIGPITSVIDEAVASAMATAMDRCRGIDPVYSWHYANTVRVFTRKHLSNTPLPLGWELGGDPAKMGQIILTKPGLIDLRFLKGSTHQPGLVPHAGSTLRRQQTWSQSPLPELGAGFSTTGPHTFLMLWNYAQQSRLDSGFTLHLAHPIGPGRYGSRVPCDLLIDIPQGGTAFENLAFPAFEDVEDFFDVAVEQDESYSQ